MRCTYCRNKFKTADSETTCRNCKEKYLETQCNHDIDVKVVDGFMVTYCRKCGAIFSTQPFFRQSLY